MATQKPIVVVGSINTDLVAIAERIPSVGETIIGRGFQVHPGGKGANQAVAVARLGYPARMIGRLGDDHFGAQLRTHMESLGVDCSSVAQCEGPSGVAVILVSSKGENCIVVAPGANAMVTPKDVEANRSVIARAGAVLAQLEIPLETVECLARICGREGVPLILDPAPAQDLPGEMYRNVAWFTPNESEAQFYGSNGSGVAAKTSAVGTAQSILSQGCCGVLLKLGSRGAYLATPDHPGKMVPAFQVTAVDSTAAGDAFNGGFATGLMLGKSPFDSALFGSAVAAISVTRVGAQPSMPSMPEVTAFLEEHLAHISAELDHLV